jgi:rfaE bifunctional protein kinase chain/domain
VENQLIDVINNFQDKKIVVIGDMVADVYLYGSISRISREAPVLVLNQAEEKIVAGGAGNVVHNIATLGGSVWPVGLLGQDTAGAGLEQIFTQKGVDVHGLLSTADRSTITKTRIIAGGLATVSQQVVRIDKEPTEPISSAMEAKLQELLADVLNKADGVVISDYGSGTLTNRITKQIIDCAKQRGIPSMVDSRYNIAAFTGIDFVKQNEAEASASVGFSISDEESLHRAGEILLEKLKAKGILITRGGQGMTLFESNGQVHNIPVASLSEVYDVSGAGDTCVAAMILALTAGAQPAKAAWISNIAAGLVVRKLGTATVSAAELKNAIGVLK